MSSALRLRLPVIGAGLAVATTASALLLTTGTGKRLMSTHTPDATAAENPSGGKTECNCEPLVTPIPSTLTRNV